MEIPQSRQGDGLWDGDCDRVKNISQKALDQPVDWGLFVWVLTVIFSF